MVHFPSFPVTRSVIITERSGVITGNGTFPFIFLLYLYIFQPRGLKYIIYFFIFIYIGLVLYLKGIK